MDGASVGVFVIIAAVTLITIAAMAALLWDREAKHFGGSGTDAGEDDAFSGTREYVANRRHVEDQESELPGLFGCGWMLLIGGIAIAVVSCFMTVTASVPMPISTNPYLSGLSDVREVVNISLLQRQMMVFQAGLATAISGVTCICAALIRNSMQH